MKKQILLISILLASSFSMSSCNSDSTDGKVAIRKKENIDSYVRIETYAELVRIARYEPAVIMIDKAGCTYCNETIPLLNAYIKKTENIIYVVDYSLVYIQALNSDDNQTGLYAGLFPNIKSTPSFLYYQGGKLLDAHDGNYAPNTLESNISSHLCEIGYYSLNTYHKQSNIMYDEDYLVVDQDEDRDILGIDTTTLDEKIKAGKCLIVYTWRQCTDCIDFYDSFFYSYRKNKHDVKVYYYETDGYYQLKSSYVEEDAKEGNEKWSSFSKAHYLTDYQGIYDNYGNETGVVPTILYYNGDSHASFVYRNSKDVYVNSEGKLQYKTSFLDDVKSLVSDTVVKSTDEVSSSTYQKALKELEEKALVIERKKMKEFFDAYLS